MGIEYLIGGILCYLILNGILAGQASKIAEDKGYDKQKWFHMCFWLGLVSYIIIASMPDLIMREKQNKTNELLDRMIVDRMLKKYE